MRTRVLVLFLWLLSGAAMAVDPPKYNVVTASVNGDPRAINDHGDSLWEEVENGRYVGAFYSGGVRTVIRSAIGETRAVGLNNHGQVVGTYNIAEGDPFTNRRAFLYSDGNMTNLGTLGGNNSIATHITDQGMIIGESTTASGATHGFYYTAQTGMVDIGTLGGQNTHVSDIDAAGRVLGYSQTATGEWRNFLYVDGTMTMLENANNWLVYEFNPHGGYIGTFQADDFSPSIAFLADDNGTVTTPYDLGRINEIDSRGYAIGYDQERFGRIAAPSGPAWMLYEMTDDPAWSDLFVVADVNSAGQILAIACRKNGGGCDGVILDPVPAIPEPGAWSMLAAGLGIVGWTARRRRRVL
jgi:probable HAF family extracellular repeat protein